MQRAEDDKFYRLLHRRLRFRGRYDGYKESCSRRDGNPVYSIVFVDVVDVPDGSPFRNHVHIKVPRSVVNTLEHHFNRGDAFEFTAEVYEYLKQQQDYNGHIYRAWSIGLRDMRKLTPIQGGQE